MEERSSMMLLGHANLDDVVACEAASTLDLTTLRLQDIKTSQGYATSTAWPKTPSVSGA